MDSKTTGAEQELYLAPETEKIENAEEIANASVDEEKYTFSIFYDPAEKELIFSEMERLGCVIERQSDVESSVTATISKKQLAAIKSLGCVERVEVLIDTQERNEVEQQIDDLTKFTEHIGLYEGFVTISQTDVAAVQSTTYASSNTASTAITLTLGVGKTGQISCPCDAVWYKFTPSTTAYYEICSTGSGSVSIDIEAYLYDSSMNYVDYDDDNGEYLNFKMVNKLTAGKTYYIRVNARGYLTGGFKVYVKKIPVSSVKITTSAKTLEVGEKRTFKVSVSPSTATNPKVTWQSSNTAVAIVSSKGVVTAKKAGSTIITAISADNINKSDCCTVTVKMTQAPSEDKGEPKLPERTIADPIDVYSGAHLLTNTLMTLMGGQSLTLTAHYDSSRTSIGMLGKGWYYNYEKFLISVGEDIYAFNGPSTYSKYIYDESSNTYVCTTPSKNGYVLTLGTSQQYPFVINCNSQCMEYYNSNGYISKIVDHQGFETTILYSDTLITITDSVSGKSIYLEKNDEDKIVKVYDNASRQTKLSYTGNMLTNICDMNNNCLVYTYNEDGRVLTGTDAKGTCYFINTYDESGRVIQQRDGVACPNTTTFVYDGNNRITTNRNGDQSTREYDSNGLLVKYTDENGNGKTYLYDERYNVIAETDANEKSVTKVYNSFNKPTEITDKNGNITHISYDSSGNITKITHPKINEVAPEETFVYNSRNLLTQHIDLRGTKTVYTYDDTGMPASKKVGNKNAIQYSYVNGLLDYQTDAKGNTTRYGYNAIGQMTSMTDAENNVTLYEYDACGNLLKTTYANGKSVINAYDCNHQKTSVTDANGNFTRYSYNGNMKNDAVILPDENTILYEFDGEDRPIKVIDQAKNETITTYDKVGRVVCKTLPDGSTLRYEYDKVGNVLKETNPKGAITQKTYDANGNVLTVTDDDDNVTVYEYNAMGKVKRSINAVLGTTVYEYSDAGDLLKETNALLEQKSYTYDEYGNKQTETDAKGGVTTYTYDANNNLHTVCDPLGNTTTYNYNGLNQLISVKDAKNNIIYYGYDALGRRTTVIDANKNVFTTIYDANGNVVKTVDAMGNTVSETVYNSLNLPQSVTDSEGKTTNYTYNSLGKVETVTDAMNHSHIYSYNSRGLNTSVRDSNNGLSIAQYDALGNITLLSGPLGAQTTYTYDIMGRLVSESTSSGGTINYNYNALNLKAGQTNAKGQARSYTYDALGRITGYSGVDGSASYTYDKNGNVLTATDATGTVSRTYDAINRITEYTDTYGNKIKYEYDMVGNPLKITNQPIDVTALEGGTAVVSFSVIGDRLQYRWYHKSKNATEFVYTDEFTCNTYSAVMNSENDGLQVYCVICDKYGNSVTTKTATISKGTGVEIIEHPKNVTVSNGTEAKVSVDAIGDGLVYNWYYKDTCDSDYSLATTNTGNTYSVNMTDEVAGREVYCIITDIYGNGALTDTVILNKGNSVKITSQPTSVTVALDESAAVRVTATGDGLTYKWYYKNKDDTEFKYTSTFTGRTYSAIMNSTRAGRQVYCVVTDAYGNSAQTKTVTLNMSGTVKITTQPTDVTVALDESAAVRVTATGDGLTYKWYYKNKDDTEFKYTSTFTGRTYSAIMNSTRAGRQVYCVVTDEYGISAQTNTVTLNMSGTVKITTQPTDVTVALEESAAVRVTATGDGLTYKWYYKNKDDTEFKYTSTFTGRTYSAIMNSTRAGRQVYCVVTDEYGISEQTNTVTLNMANTVMITKQPVTQTVAMGMVAVVDFTATGDGLTYKWYFRNRDYTNFHYTSTYTDNIYRAIMSDERQGREVYCIVTDAYGNSVQTNTVAINAKSYTKITYPDNTEVINAYDANNNLLSVTDWENRVTAYTYDANNRVIGVTKPDGSVTTTVYDNKQRVVSTTEKTASGTVITGFEYVYDALSRIVEEKHLADNTKICYTYDSLSRVTNRTVLNEVDELISSENYSYDAAGNITQAADSCFQYDANNRLTVFNGDAVTYDLDGNMLSNGAEYDSANRLISAGNNIYTYNVEDVRIRNLCGEYDTTYVYNTNCKLSQLLCKTTNGITTKYIYGLGLIGEEKCGEFKTYHFDYRGSTVAITDECGNITDTFKYDTYGKMVEHIGNSFVIFGYNGRDGVVTDKNGLIYMRARYYSPEMRRFINADILHGEISDSTSLNRYSYVNGNPVSFVDPFGLSAERGNVTIYYGNIWGNNKEQDMLYSDVSIAELINILSSLSVIKSEKQHLQNWKKLVKLFSNENMQPVLLDMIDHFVNGQGAEYSNKQLTNAVKNHSVTQEYMKDFTSVFKTFMSKYKGDYGDFAQGKEFKDALKANGVLISKYAYGGGLFDKDTWGGLTMAVHGWTESQVDITESYIFGNKYFGNLQFTFVDNFGLDADDLKEFGSISGFESWYALQHNKDYEGKYQPFKTVVTINYKFSGSF